MDTTIRTHCDTALESPYSHDREEAIEELVEVFPGANATEKSRIVETLRQVAFDSSSRTERELARDGLLECFEADTQYVEETVVDAFCELAESSKFSSERLEAIDTLRELARDVHENQRDVVARTLADVAGNATYEDERRRARQRLSDISRSERQRARTGDQPDDSSQTGAVSYLGESLAEHLAHAAHESPDACLQRAEEVSEFVEEYRVSDEAYQAVKQDVDALVQQLRVIPTDDTLDEERIDRVEHIAARVERLYTRQ